MRRRSDFRHGIPRQRQPQRPLRAVADEAQAVAVAVAEAEAAAQGSVHRPLLVSGRASCCRSQ